MAFRRKIRTSLVAIAADLLLVGIKSALATVTGSLALAADAFHSLADLIVSLTVLGSLLAREWYERRTGAKSPLRRDNGPSGTGPQSPGTVAAGRNGAWLESLVAGTVSVAILAVPIEILSSVRAAEDEPIRNAWIGIVGVALTIAIAYFISRFKLHVGRQTDSPALEADGRHSSVDVLSSIGVLLAFFGQSIGIDLDPVVAVIIAVLIAITGIELLASAIVSFHRRSGLEQLSAWEMLEPKLSELRRRVRQTRFPRALSYGIPTTIAALYVGSGLTRVELGEVGARYRFEKIVDSPLGPGLHYALPAPFERIAIFQSDAVKRVEIGFRTDEDGTPAAQFYWDSSVKDAKSTQLSGNALVVTGDQNIVDIRLVIAYRPTERLEDRLRIEEADKIVAALGESVLSEIAAAHRSDQLLTTHKQRFVKEVEERLSAILADMKLGYRLVDVSLRQIAPPGPIVRAYREVFAAREDQTKLISEAETYSFEKASTARSEALRKELGAEAERLEKSLRAEGDGAYFTQLAAQYRLAPEVTSYRLFVESAEKVLAGVPKVVGRSSVNRGEYRYWLFEPPFPSKSRGARR